MRPLAIYQEKNMKWAADEHQLSWNWYADSPVNNMLGYGLPFWMNKHADFDVSMTFYLKE